MAWHVSKRPGARVERVVVIVSPRKGVDRGTISFGDRAQLLLCVRIWSSPPMRSHGDDRFRSSSVASIDSTPRKGYLAEIIIPNLKSST